MTEKKKKIIKIISIVLIVLAIFASVYFYIKAYSKNKTISKGLVLLSEVTDIRETLNDYHIKYGSYPQTEEVKLNSSYICDYEFNNKNCISEKTEFRKYDNIFLYRSNDPGSYEIITQTQYDNEYLGCVHDKKDKIKGCIFTFGIDYMNVD